MVAFPVFGIFIFTPIAPFWTLCGRLFKLKTKKGLEGRGRFFVNPSRQPRLACVRTDTQTHWQTRGGVCNGKKH